ncbi:hypothetical protein HK097_007427 [Rhizophlyctis rosea]|uniref:Uncharacterized protein n=1 Tax=Rhizophlyctis rosea TaxID=64517 RepID=A0AAD5SBS4_9FUNG|nr:hypothetical protein HK097_007427 [Rhizophlyctis rosea]
MSTSTPGLSQAANVALTVSQTRLLLNSLCSKTGFVNIRLSETEYEMAKSIQTEVHNAKIDFNCTALSNGNHPWLQDVVESALEYFKIPMSASGNITLFEIPLGHARHYYKRLSSSVTVNGEDYFG